MKNPDIMESFASQQKHPQVAFDDGFVQNNSLIFNNVRQVERAKLKYQMYAFRPRKHIDQIYNIIVRDFLVFCSRDVSAMAVVVVVKNVKHT